MLKLQVIGNLGSDPELKQTKSGRQYLSFSVAHDRGRDVPSVWVRVVWFNGIGHPLQQYIRKGAKLCVYGDAAVEAYMDKNNQPAAGITLYPDTVDVVLFPKREEGTAPAAPAGEQRAPRVWGPGTPGYAAPEAGPGRPAPAAPAPVQGPGNPPPYYRPGPAQNAAGIPAPVGGTEYFEPQSDDLPF